MTAVIALMWRDEQIKPPITGCLLTIPAYVDNSAVPEQYKAEYKSFEQYVKITPFHAATSREPTHGLDLDFSCTHSSTF